MRAACWTAWACAALERDMASLRRAATAAANAQADLLEERIERLREQVRDLVDRNLLLFARGETEKFREELLRSARLTNLERRDLERMRVLVRAIARKLATRYAKPRRRKLRGQLDVRRTLRRNMAWDSIPFVTVWKQKRIEKPRVMVLCDVSGSVAAMAQFLLMFLYALHEALADIRGFAFTSSTIEVSDILESGTDRGGDRQDHADDRLWVIELRELAGGFRGGLGALYHQQDDADHPGRRARQPHRSAHRRVPGDRRAGEAGDLAESGIPRRRGARGIRTCCAIGRSATWRRCATRCGIWNAW